MADAWGGDSGGGFHAWCPATGAVGVFLPLAPSTHTHYISPVVFSPSYDQSEVLDSPVLWDGGCPSLSAAFARAPRPASLHPAAASRSTPCTRERRVAGCLPLSSIFNPPHRPVGMSGGELIPTQYTLNYPLNVSPCLSS